MTSMINNSSGNPYQDQGEVSSGMMRFASDQTGMAMINQPLPHGFVFQLQTMFQDAKCEETMNILAFQKDMRDCTFSLRMQAMQYMIMQYTGTWMQSINKALQLGFQMNYSPMQGTMFGYCAYYQLGEKMNHQFSACYNPANPKENYNLSYISKPSARLQLFTELKGKVNGSFLPETTDYTGGFKLKFSEGSVTGYMDSKLKAYGNYTKSMEGGAIRMELNSMIDFMNKGPGKKCNFGMSLSLGPG